MAKLIASFACGGMPYAEISLILRLLFLNLSLIKAAKNIFLTPPPVRISSSGLNKAFEEMKRGNIVILKGFINEGNRLKVSIETDIQILKRHCLN